VKTAQANFNAKQHFASRLEQAVERDGRSKGAIAASMGVQASALSRWLSGVIPDADNLKKLANSLRVSVQWLLTDEENEIREDVRPYHFTPRAGSSIPGPFPQPTDSDSLLAGCHALLHAMPHAKTKDQFDYAVQGFEALWERTKLAKYAEL
jgi:transcriptional regulator with XRE-family HTH domain